MGLMQDFGENLSPKLIQWSSRGRCWLDMSTCQMVASLLFSYTRRPQVHKKPNYRYDSRLWSISRYMKSGYLTDTISNRTFLYYFSSRLLNLEASKIFARDCWFLFWGRRSVVIFTIIASSCDNRSFFVSWWHSRTARVPVVRVGQWNWTSRA